MGATKKPRKPYVKKPALRRPMTYSIDADSALHLQLVPHQALIRMMDGSSDEGDWHTVTCRLNIGLSIANELFPLAQDDLTRSLGAMKEVWERFEFLKKLGLSGDQHQAVAMGLTLTDDMQKQCTRRELRDIMNKVFEVAGV